MKLHNIHTTAEERIANHAEQTALTIKDVAKKIDESNQISQKISQEISDKSLETQFIDVSQRQIEAIKQLHNSLNQERDIKKLEEVKSAALITNRLLKEIKKTLDQDDPDIDFGPVVDQLIAANQAMQRILEKMEKPWNIKLTLKLQ